MSKSKNRETVTLGQATPPELAQQRDEELQRLNRSRFAELVEAETAAANAHADKMDEQLASGLFRDGSADPGSVVGLDGMIPSSDTPDHGDPDRTDPHSS